MSDIFISYAREDQDRIATLVHLLEARGLSVFWDRDIPPGKTWREHIGRALAEARCVVVAWSRDSIASTFVAEEADDARVRGILVPVLIDEVMPPLGFRSWQAARLTGLGQPGGAQEFDELLAAVRSVVGGGATGPSSPPRQVPPRRSTGRRRAAVVAAFGAGAVAVALLAAWWMATRNTPADAALLRHPATVANAAGAGRAAAGAAADAIEILHTLRTESGGLRISVRVTHRGEREMGVGGVEAFAAVARDGSVAMPLDSSPMHVTLQPGASQKFSLSFSAVDAVALRVTLAGQPALDLPLPTRGESSARSP